MTAPNPLVAERQDSTQWYTGLGLAESVADTAHGIESGSWIDSSLGVVGAGLDTLGLVLDPVGSVVAWGIAWLMEHLQPLSDALDALAGDPDQVAANAATWKNAAGHIDAALEDFRRALAADIAEWTGPAAGAYRTRAEEQIEGMTAIGKAANAIGTGVELSGVLVGVVREIVRDLIAECISTLAVRLPMWLAEVGLTLGIGTPLVAGQVATLVTRWVNRIAGFLEALIRSFRKLSPLLSKLDELMDAIRKIVRRVDGVDPNAPHHPPGGRQTGGEIRNPRNAVDFEIEWAEEAYDSIRRSDDDIAQIAGNVEQHGFSADDIRQVKNHVFHEEHLLDRYPPGEMGRFDANPRMAEAWQRLTDGNPHPSDIDLLRHELYESNHMKQTGSQSYSAAHDATNNAGHTWDPEAAARDGLGYPGGN
jgi:uncharacterized protein YukE